MTQLQLQAGGDVLSALAAQLGVQVSQLVYWGRVGGKKAVYVATPQERRSASSSTTSEGCGIQIVQTVACWRSWAC
jgi:hypothetical protein